MGDFFMDEAIQNEFIISPRVRSNPAETIISAHHISKRYKGCLALNDVSFDVHRGDLIGLVGKNGAGKTTLIRVLTGVAHPTSGSFTLFGSSDSKSLTHNLGKVAAMIEQPALYNTMTATQNLLTRCILMGIENPMDGYIRDKLEFVGLDDAYHDKRKVKDYSLGMRQRVGIAMSMIGEPELMVLDEPTNGLDPEGIRQIRELLLRLNKEKGVTMIVSSHILSELSKFASSYIFIDRGVIVQQITASELEAKVGKVLILSTSDNITAYSLLKNKNFDVEMVKDSLYVHDILNPADVLNILQEEKITLKAMKEEENSLEDYFMNLVTSAADRVFDAKGGNI
jgi:ABC-2 type transport system ATP-binding protein